MRLVTMIVVCALLACGGASEQQDPAVPDPVDDSITTPSGRRGFVVSCAAAAKCLEEAGRRCPSGYELRDMGVAGSDRASATKGKAVAIPIGESAVAVGSEQTVTSESLTREFMVECKSARERGEPPKMLGPCNDGANPPTEEEIAACTELGGSCIHRGAGLFSCAQVPDGGE